MPEQQCLYLALRSCYCILCPLKPQQGAWKAPVIRTGEQSILVKHTHTPKNPCFRRKATYHQGTADRHRQHDYHSRTTHAPMIKVRFIHACMHTFGCVANSIFNIKRVILPNFYAYSYYNIIDILVVQFLKKFSLRIFSFTFTCDNYRLLHAVKPYLWILLVSGPLPTLLTPVQQCITQWSLTYNQSFLESRVQIKVLATHQEYNFCYMHQDVTLGKCHSICLHYQQFNESCYEV